MPLFKIIALGLAALVTAAQLSTRSGSAPANPNVQGEQPAAIRDADEILTLVFPAEGFAVESLLSKYAELSGRKLTFNPKVMANRSIRGLGRFTFKRSEVDLVLQGLLLANDLAVTLIGRGTTEVYVVEDVKTSTFMKQNARHVRLEDIPACLQRPGEVIGVTVPLVNVSVDKAQRALAHLIGDQRQGFVVPIEEANTLLIVNLPGLVSTMIGLLRAAEDAAASENGRTWRTKLNAEK
jgi:hypothetical protein